jgi:hypothetical protein
MGLSNLLPWQFEVLILIGGGIYVLLFAKSLWKANNKIAASSFILLSLIGFSFGLDYLYSGLNKGPRLIPTNLFDALFALFIILLFTGSLLKLKKEKDPVRLKQATIFIYVSAIAMLILIFLYYLSLSK